MLIWKVGYCILLQFNYPIQPACSLRKQRTPGPVPALAGAGADYRSKFELNRASAASLEHTSPGRAIGAVSRLRLALAQITTESQLGTNARVRCRGRFSRGVISERTVRRVGRGARRGPNKNGPRTVARPTVSSGPVIIVVMTQYMLLGSVI